MIFDTVHAPALLASSRATDAGMQQGELWVCLDTPFASARPSTTLEAMGLCSGRRTGGAAVWLSRGMPEERLKSVRTQRPAKKQNGLVIKHVKAK